MLGALRYGLHHGGWGRRVHAHEAAAAADEHRARRGRLKHHRHAELLHFRGHAGALAALGRQIAEFRVVLAHKPVEALGDEDLPLRGGSGLSRPPCRRGRGSRRRRPAPLLGGDAAAAGFTLCTAPFLTVIPVTAVRLKAFAPFWRPAPRGQSTGAWG